nr:MAG TPA: Proteasome-associated ATPase, Prokaryotic ubiquitin-like protein coil alpha helix, ATP-binding.8A [Caudoviricetes sp.]
MYTEQSEFSLSVNHDRFVQKGGQDGHSAKNDDNCCHSFKILVLIIW